MGLLTAEFPPTSGDAILAGFSVMHEPQKIRQRIGYCPQFDALYGCLTAREHLLLYGAVKGIPKRALADAATKKLSQVGLKPADWDRVCSGFSGGMKRRLSLACSTMGEPKLIFLDECSTGVDPVSRREIWQLVSNMVAGQGLPQHEKPSVILTTHSMDECEALCPRIGIMANGRLRCLGSAQHLKNKFGRGFQVELNVKLIQLDDIDYLDVFAKLNQFVSGSSLTGFHGLNIGKCTQALQILTGDDSLSSMISTENPTGYLIWKDATSPIGVSMEDLAAFAVSEQRITKVQDFVKDSFPESVLRERQDMRVRYEVSGPALRISEIFAKIEDNKQDLQLADYGVSQTSLEQVFNMHAAEAESLKANPAAPATVPSLGSISVQLIEDSAELVC
jgi:ATP-binding cassette, subfamily A (ABC1), member 3